MSNQALAVMNSTAMSMSSREIADDAKPQGYLYAVVFDTGALKIGMSERNPLSRIRSHRSAGRQFGVSIAKTLIVRVYTMDVAERETRLIESLRQVAFCTSGREWFKFECKKSASQFVTDSMGSIEAESYAARPSREQLAIASTKNSTGIEDIISLLAPRYTPPVRHVEERRLFAIRQFLASFDLPPNGDEEAYLIELFYRFDRLVADCESGTKKFPESAVGMDCYGIDHAMAFSREDEEQRGLAAIAIHNFIGDTELQHSLAVSYGGSRVTPYAEWAKYQLVERT